MTAYYNDNDKFVCAWLRELIKEGLIADGEVDERPIQEVMPRDLWDFTQCHFFAGIGGWSYALRLAGWPDDRPVWTGSCPCQPLSSAGQRKGHVDERHLWPAFYRLIAECRPPVVFGEQVASKDGREWLAGVRADMEALGHAVGAADLCAAGVGAPHIRQRLYWVADTGRRKRFQIRQETERGQSDLDWSGRLGDANSARHEVRTRLAGNDGTTEQSTAGQAAVETSIVGGVEHSASDGRIERRSEPSGRSIASGCSESRMAYANGGDEGDRYLQRSGQHGQRSQNGWLDSRWLEYADGKRRRVPLESALFPLATGLPGRVGILRGAGNSIIPQVAATFIESFMTTED